MHRAYVKNTTTVPQKLGYWEIAPGEIAVPPEAVLTAIRSRPIKELVVLDDNPDTWIFKTTEHQPFNSRYS